MGNASLNPGCALALLVIGCASPNVVLHDAVHPFRPPTGTNSVVAVKLGTLDSCSVHLVQVRDAEPLHIHAHHDLVVVIKRGHGLLRLGEREMVVRPGDVLLIPRGVPHAFRNRASRPALAIATFNPPFDGKDFILVNSDARDPKKDSGVARQGGGGGEPL